MLNLHKFHHLPNSYLKLMGLKECSMVLIIFRLRKLIIFHGRVSDQKYIALLATILIIICLLLLGRWLSMMERSILMIQKLCNSSNRLLVQESGLIFNKMAEMLSLYNSMKFKENWYSN